MANPESGASGAMNPEKIDFQADQGARRTFTTELALLDADLIAAVLRARYEAAGPALAGMEGASWENFERLAKEAYDAMMVRVCEAIFGKFPSLPPVDDSPGAPVQKVD